MKLSKRLSFYLLASITVSFVAGSMVPTPLFPVYQAAWGFSALAVTAIFAIYALTLLFSLLVAGRLSDHLGRKPVLIAASLTQVLVMLLFASADGVADLLWARALQGLATGVALGAVGAGLLDLDKTRGPVTNAVILPLGTGVGGLLTGLFVHYLPAPTLLTYYVLASVLLLQSAGLLLMPETVTRQAGAFASLKPKLRVSPSAAGPMLLAFPILVAAWSLLGFYGALVPAMLRSSFGTAASLASGLAIFVMATSAALTILASQKKAPDKMMSAGALGLMAGIAIAVLALSGSSLSGFFLGTILAGFGFGAGFQGAVRTVVPAALPHERAGVLSVIFLVSYLAMGIPAIVAGLFISRSGNLLLTMQVYGGTVFLLAALVLARQWFACSGKALRT